MDKQINYNATYNVKPVVLVAPLDWGLGHATRCIPVIKECLTADCEVIIAASGKQYKLLKSEFPTLEIVELPGYQLNYGKKRWSTLVKLLLQAPKILIKINQEKKWLRKIYNEKHLDIIISDNRFGLHHNGAITVFITHQLLIKAPGKNRKAESILQKLNYKFINRFTHCWVPDAAGALNLAGALSHPAVKPAVPVTYLGSLSRIKKQLLPVTNKLLVLLSGPEPQRSLLEEKILQQLSALQLPAVVVRGLPSPATSITGSYPLLQLFDHLNSEQLQQMIAQSAIIISRPGYSTIMDVLPIGKKCIFIPTPGQTEQEYLAAYLAGKGWCCTTLQDDLQLHEQITKAEQLNIPDLSELSNPQLLTAAVAHLVSQLNTAKVRTT